MDKDVKETFGDRDDDEPFSYFPGKYDEPFSMSSLGPSVQLTPERAEYWRAYAEPKENEFVFRLGKDGDFTMGAFWITLHRPWYRRVLSRLWPFGRNKWKFMVGVYDGTGRAEDVVILGPEEDRAQGGGMTDSLWQRVKCRFGKHTWLQGTVGVRVGSTRACIGLRCQVKMKFVLEETKFVWIRE